MDLIEIDGGAAVRYKDPSDNLKRSSLEELVGAMTNWHRDDAPLSTPTLPHGARYYARTGKAEVFVVEEEPAVRAVRAESDKGVAWFRLSFPYVVYVFLFDHGIMPAYRSRVFYRTRPITSMRDRLFLTNLTHVNSRDNDDYLAGTACFGIRGGRYHRGSVADMVTKAMESFWSSAFLMFYGGSRWDSLLRGMAERDARVQSFNSWQEETKANPRFSLGVDWMSANCSILQAAADTLDFWLSHGSVVGHENDGDIVSVDMSLGVFADTILRIGDEYGPPIQVQPEAKSPAREGEEG